MPPSERIHVPTAKEAGMLPKASFIFTNAHTREPDTHLTSSPFCQMSVHDMIWIQAYLHPKYSCMLCDEAQMWKPPVPPHGPGLSCKQIQTVGQLIHSSHLPYVFLFASRISTDFHTFHTSQFPLPCNLCCSKLVCLFVFVLWEKISIWALVKQLKEP